MMHNNFYYQMTNCLLILPPKCASSSIKQSCGLTHWIERDQAEAANHLPTIAFIRHPWERIVSALYSCLFSFAPFSERLTRYLEADDSHLRPQARMLHGLRIDRLIRFERLADEWPKLQTEFGFAALPHLAARLPDRQQTWQQEPFDWDSLLPLYAKDFELCPDWNY